MPMTGRNRAKNNASPREATVSSGLFSRQWGAQPRRVAGTVAFKQNDPEDEVLSISVQGICRMFVPSDSTCLPFPLSGEACSLPLLSFLPTPARCDTNLSFGVIGLLTKKSCIWVLYRVYWPFRRHPSFWGWWEFSMFPLGTINFHMWATVSLNQMLSDWKNELWWALSLFSLSTAHSLPDTQHSCSFWSSHPCGHVIC